MEVHKEEKLCRKGHERRAIGEVLLRYGLPSYSETEIVCLWSQVNDIDIKMTETSQTRSKNNMDEFVFRDDEKHTVKKSLTYHGRLVEDNMKKNNDQRKRSVRCNTTYMGSDMRRKMVVPVDDWYSECRKGPGDKRKGRFGF